MTDTAAGVPPRSVPAIARAAGMLRALAGRREASLTDLARAVGIHKSTAHGILGTLNAFGLVERDPATLRYRLGSGLVTLARAAHGAGDLGVLAGPHLVPLSRHCGETVAVHIPDGGGSIIVASEESSHPLKVSAPVGFRMPPYAGAVAKVFEALDASPRAVPDALLAYTARSITQPDRWLRELDKVRRAGFALDDMEFQDGIRAASVPVMLEEAGRRELIAAYSIIAAAPRVSTAALRDWVPALTSSAGALADSVRRSRTFDRGGHRS